jgi:predicted nuclease of predicted toxin-antitoxin system
VKLLFDQNISPRLIPWLADLFPGSAHVRDFGLQKADDDAIWSLARQQDFTIVSKDSDFRQRSFLHGPPPRVIWVQRGNCSTQEIEAILRQHHQDIQSFHDDPAAAFLILS